MKLKKEKVYILKKNKKEKVYILKKNKKELRNGKRINRGKNF